MLSSTLVDRRARAGWDDRRNDLGRLPSDGIRTSKIVRTQAGRRAGDRVDAPTAYPHPSMIARETLVPTGFIDTDGRPYYMPSGQRIA